MQHPLALSEPELHALAPDHLVSLRRERYTGADMGISLARLAEGDRHTLREVYERLLALLDALRPDTRGEVDPQAVRDLLADGGHHALLDPMNRFGTESIERDPEPRLAKAVHDLRGGAFPAIVFMAEMIETGTAESGDLRQMFFWVRDHLKIARNAVAGLDPERYAADLAGRPHGVDLLVQKWRGAAYHAARCSAEVAVDCRWRGWISERCVEFSAVDRVVYNLVNNAARHAHTGQVVVYLLPVGADGTEPTELRVVVVDAVGAGQATLLRNRYPQGLGELFAGGFTSGGGSGLGLSICADFVSHAYGLDRLADAVGGGYMGARLIRDRFVAWFHWPMLAD